jgi:alcohol dehydrogenase
MLVDELKKLNRQLGIPEGLAAVGVTEDKIPQMAADAIKSANIAVNPRQSTVRDLEALYKKAM